MGCIASEVHDENRTIYNENRIDESEFVDVHHS